MNTNSKIKINMDSLKTSKEWVRHKVKNGNNVYRILPPFGESSNGYPFRKWQIIWGLADPSNGRVRPYASSLMAEKRDPVVEYVEELRARLDQMEGDLKAKGLDEKQVQKHAKYARLSKFIRDINPKTTYLYNAVDKSGTVGLLELKSKAHKKMKALMADYIRDYNQDPTSLNSADDDSGVWFNVKRTGDTFQTTEYDVEKVQTKQKVGASMSFVDDRSALPDVVVQNFDNLAYDLGSVYKLNTYDELNEVLQANLDNFYEVCPEANLSKPVDLDAEDEEVAPVKTASPAKAATSTTSKPQGKAVALKLQDDDDEDEALLATAKKTVAKVQVDDDDFMAQADAILKG